MVTGGVLGRNLKTIGSEKVAVPNQFYKIILDYNDGNPKVLAFLMPHVNSNKPLYEFVVSVDTVEELTGINFFPELEDAIETRMESSRSYNKWRF
ncbi:DNA/RNA non-specific endonuclease [Bizionia echini]|uniref:DNA/RNA non-specific endonuclease n=1 Tax=Bizionia echini TaxID=649333 RepID=A0A1I5CY87_9FLAO|nr:DNA/RNA non-specific endonuclease [Bizionia echini]